MRFVSAAARRRTSSQLLYALLGLPIGVAGFTFVVAELSVGTTLLVTLVGLPLLAITGVASRWFGSRMRLLANAMLGTDVPPAHPFRAKPGLLGWISSCLTDGTAWRARLYFTLKLPIGIVGCVVAVVGYGYGLAGVTYAAWRPFLPCDSQDDGVCHRAAQLGHHYFDTPSQVLLVLATGAVLLLASPQLVHAVLAIDKIMVRSLLGPTSARTPVERRGTVHNPANSPRATAEAVQSTWSRS